MAKTAATTCHWQGCWCGGKRGKGYTSSPNLAALPPTREAFIENVKRVHLQAILWRTLNPLPTTNPEDCGWQKDTYNKSLSPTMLPQNTSLAPDLHAGDDPMWLPKWPRLQFKEVQLSGILEIKHGSSSTPSQSIGLFFGCALFSCWISWWICLIGIK